MNAYGGLYWSRPRDFSGLLKIAEAITKCRYTVRKLKVSKNQFKVLNPEVEFYFSEIIKGRKNFNGNGRIRLILYCICEIMDIPYETKTITTSKMYCCTDYSGSIYECGCDRMPKGIRKLGIHHLDYEYSTSAYFKGFCTRKIGVVLKEKIYDTPKKRQRADRIFPLWILNQTRKDFPLDLFRMILGYIYPEKRRH